MDEMNSVLRRVCSKIIDAPSVCTRSITINKIGLHVEIYRYTLFLKNEVGKTQTPVS